MTRVFFDDPEQLAPPRVQREDLGGGAFILRSPEALGEHVKVEVAKWFPIAKASGAALE